MLAADGEIWTVGWPPGYQSETRAEGEVDLIGPGGVVASAGDRVAVNGHERGMHPLCMIGSHFDVTEIVAIAHLADKTGEYVTDELIVQFDGRPSRASLEAFEAAHGLTRDHRRFENGSYLFRITDGTDAWEKRLTVGADPSVRRVNLNWLGTLFGALELGGPYGQFAQ